MRTAKGHSKLDSTILNQFQQVFRGSGSSLWENLCPDFQFSVYVHAWLQGGKPDLWAFGFLKCFASCFFFIIPGWYLLHTHRVSQEKNEFYITKIIYFHVM
jgi:hypothetical protein